MGEAREVANLANYQSEEQKRDYSLMDTCHLKNAESEPKYQKYKGRVVLRGDIVKDDSYASQMTDAKVMGVIARLPDCAGQAADAVSAYTQEKWKTLPNC